MSLDDAHREHGRRGQASASAVSTRFIPGRRLAWLVALALPLFALGRSGIAAGLLFDLILLALALQEARLLTRLVPRVERRLERRLLLGVDNDVRIRLHNTADRRLRVSVRDDTPTGFHPRAAGATTRGATEGTRSAGRARVHQEPGSPRADADEASPDALEAEDALQRVGVELHDTLEPFGRHELHYTVVPQRRGRHTFGAVHLRIEGAWSLGAVLARYEATEEVRVYPNLRGPRRYELALRLGALHSVGVRSLRRVGGGGEFEQLREYVPGDPFRDLDWKATAKRHRPVTRVHGQERSQTVIVAVDAGRMMATQLDAITKLDHAINAALLLSYVALRSGDKVGLIVFAEDVRAFVPPRGGQSQYQRLLEALYAIEASPTFVDFRRLTEFVRARVPRRALLLLFSDLLDESQALPLTQQASLLGRRHLPLCVTMNDPIAETIAKLQVHDEEQAYRRAAAADMLAEREAIKGKLHKAGMGLVEAPASDLAVATVNRYLEIKARHAL